MWFTAYENTEETNMQLKVSVYVINNQNKKR